MSVKQNFPTIKPTLSLDFANSKAVDSRITFTRASAATYTDAQGILQTVRDNKPRIDFDATTGECRGLLIEEQRTNLLSNSSDIFANANWSLNGCITPIKAPVVSPSGLMDAYKIMENSANSRHETNFVNFPVTAGTTYVATVYAKAAERSFLALAFGGYPSATFNLTTGVATGDGTQVTGYPKMTAVGNGWYKCEFATVYPTTQANMSLYMGIQQQTGGYTANQGIFGYGLYIWGAQVEAGTFGTSYIPSTTTFVSRSSSATYYDATGVLRTAPANSPRYGYAYDSVSQKWVSQGLLLENSSTNILVGSDLYGNTLDSEAIYTKTNNSTDVVAPNGTQLTTKLVSGTSGNSWYWRIPSAGTFSGSTTYTISVWIRCATGQTAQWNLQPYPYNSNTVCNITDQWQRFSVTFTTDAAGSSPYIGLVSPTQSRTFYVWGWQTEPGSLSSYIPTYGAAATRSADVSSSAATTRAAEFTKFNMSNIGYGQPTNLGSIVNFVTKAPVTANVGVFGFTGQSQTNWGVYSFGDGSWKTYESLVGSAIKYFGYSTPDVDTKIAQSWGTNAVYGINGTSDVMVRAVGKLDTLTIGYVPYDFHLNGWIKHLKIYPQALSTTAAKALTV